MKKRKLAPAEAPERVVFTIRAVYIRKSSIVLADDFDPLVSGQELTAIFKSRPDRHITSSVQEDEKSPETIQSVSYLTQFDFAFYLPENQNEKLPLDEAMRKTVASISAVISVDYLISGAQPTPEELQRCAHSAMLHAWPYWREYCHSSLTRMQLPVVLVPLLDIRPPVETPDLKIP